MSVAKKKLTAAEIAARTQKLYKPKDKNAEIIATGATLKRPTKPEDFVLMPEDHPWRTLTGLMGFPYDIIVQVAGAPDSGKSTLAGEAGAAAQKQNVYVILWDVEKKFDRVRYDKQFGGNSDELNVVATTIIRKGAGAVIKLINTIMAADSDARILVIHDSVGGSVSRARAEQEIDDEKNAQPATEAVENSAYMKHIVALFDKYPGHIAMLLINQMTHRIGGVGKSRSGGEKVSFHSSMIVEMTRIKDLTKETRGVTMKTGILSRAKMAKNHLSLTENSVYEMQVMVDAKGWHFVD